MSTITITVDGEKVAKTIAGGLALELAKIEKSKRVNPSPHRKPK